MRRLLILSIIALTGCTYARSTQLGEGGYSPRPKDQRILVFESLVDVQRPFTKIALIWGDGAPAASWSSLEHTVLAEARRIGADAVILRDFHTEDSGFLAAASKGMVGGVILKRKKQCVLAIRFAD